jgi:Tfp pilus assembly protein PilF
VWLRNVRPALMFSYWVNAHFWKDDPYSYHIVNVVLHCVTSGLVFLIVRRLLEWSGSDKSRGVLLAGFAAGVYLLHPVQTEAVAYLAGRSEALSVMFFMGAYTVFLYRDRPAVSWRNVAAVMVLFGLALLSKEHTIVLPALLLLTDYWWNPGFSGRGIRGNWKIYVPLALGAAGGVALFWSIITRAETAGFGMKDFTWYQYFFTQCRALFVYVAMFLLPARLTVDWDFPISRTILDRGALFGLIVLVALAVAAWRWRRRFPLAAFGFFTFLVLMAPTSSVLPIRDPIAERRLYLAMPGLLLIAVDLLGRLKLSRGTLAAVCGLIVLAAAVATRARAAVWSDALALWQDTAEKSPNKARVRFQLGYAYYENGRPDLAVAEFEKTAQLEPPTYNLLVDWGLAYDALNRPEEALAKFRQAAAIERTAHIHSQIGMVLAKQGRYEEALDALATAASIDASFAMTYVYRGNIRLIQNRPAEAIAGYERALQIQPAHEEARRNLQKAREMLKRGGQ